MLGNDLASDLDSIVASSDLYICLMHCLSVCNVLLRSGDFRLLQPAFTPRQSLLAVVQRQFSDNLTWIWYDMIAPRSRRPCHICAGEKIADRGRRAAAHEAGSHIAICLTESSVTRAWKAYLRCSPNSHAWMGLEIYPH